MKKLIFIFLTCCFFSNNAIGSSALLIKRNAMVLGKNYDGISGEGMILKNNRGVKKTAYNFDHQKMAEWTSKFGSLTFNQIGKEFPYGGVNEMGLAVELLQLNNTQYGNSNKATISEFEWVQYQLDNHITAIDVALNIENLGINPLMASVHFLVADRDGRSVIIEFINGKAKVYNTNNEEYVALTNSFYSNSVNYYKESKNNINWESRSSLDRYAQLVEKGTIGTNKFVDQMFNVMEASSQSDGPNTTQWTIIYDLDHRTISYRTKQSRAIKKVYFKQFNYAHNSQQYYRNLNAKSQDWKVFNKSVNGDFLSIALRPVSINLKKLNQHMMNPSLALEDDLYSKNHKDLSITFSLKKQEGYVLVKLFNGGDNFQKFNAERQGIIAANKDSITITFYSVRVDDYAISALHDLNENNKRDKKFLGILKEPIAYSKSSKRKPNMDYEQIKFNLEDENELVIEL